MPCQEYTNAYDVDIRSPVWAVTHRQRHGQGRTRLGIIPAQGNKPARRGRASAPAPATIGSHTTGGLHWGVALSGFIRLYVRPSIASEEQLPSTLYYCSVDA